MARALSCLLSGLLYSYRNCIKSRMLQYLCWSTCQSGCLANQNIMGDGYPCGIPPSSLETAQGLVLRKDTSDSLSNNATCQANSFVNKTFDPR